MPNSEGASLGVLIWSGASEADVLVKDVVVAVALVGLRESGVAPMLSPQGTRDVGKICGGELRCLLGVKVEVLQKSLKADKVAGAVAILENV